MSSIELIPTAYVHQNWLAVEPFIDASSEWANGDFTVDQIRADLGQGRAFLYCAKDGQSVIGAAVIVFQNGRNKRVAFVLSIGGKLVSNQENFDQLAGLLKKAGATHIGGSGRPSISRLWSRFGFKEKSVLFERSI